MIKQQVRKPYQDRNEGGRILAEHLNAYLYHPKLIVLGLPRGGVPVAFQVAKGLRAPLDVFLIRKLGVPGQRELTIGAVASGNVRILDHAVTRNMGLSRAIIDASTAHERAELERREEAYRGQRPPLQITGHSVILVDDGLATGATMRAAVAALRLSKPERIVVAAPVGMRETCESLRHEVDEVACPHMPEPFVGVSRWYREFSPIMDREIRVLLEMPELAAMAF